MLLELVEEHLGQRRGLDKQGSLLAISVIYEHRGIEYRLIDQTLPVALNNLKGHSATRDALGLIANVPHALAADGDFQPRQPHVKRPAEFDLAGTTFQGFCLQVKQ